MKKIFLFIVIIAVIAAAVIMRGAILGEYSNSDKINWHYLDLGNGEAMLAPELNEAGAVVRRCAVPEPEGALKIPAVVDGRKVVAIGERAFECCDKITSVVIPEGVRELCGLGSFISCASLKKVVLPSTLELIGNHAFAHCRALKTIDIGLCQAFNWATVEGCISLQRIEASPQNAKFRTIDGGLYSKDGSHLVIYPKDKINISLPSSVATIGPCAFANASITRAKLPYGITKIEKGTFGNCPNLTEVEIPASVVEICSSAFTGSTSIKHIIFGGDAPKVQDNSLEGTADGLVVIVPRGSKGWMRPGAPILPEKWPCKAEKNAKAIRYAGETEKQAAARNFTDTTVRSAEINGAKWFYTIERGKAVLWRGRDSLHGDPCVEPMPRGKVVIPAEIGGYPVGALGSLAFFDCKEISEVVIPATVERIGNRCFLHCESLEEITLPDSVDSIGIWAFNQCGRLRRVHLGNCRELSLGGGVFAFCQEIDRYTVNPGNPFFKATGGILYSRDGKELVACPARKASVVIPEGVTRIGQFAFSDSLAEKIALPKSLESIGDGAFKNCKALCELAFAGDAPDTPGHGFGIFIGASQNLSVVVENGSRGWQSKGSDALPDTWPANGGRKVRRAYIEITREWHDAKGRGRTATLIGVSEDGTMAILRNIGETRTRTCAISRLSKEGQRLINATTQSLPKYTKQGNDWVRLDSAK